MTLGVMVVTPFGIVLSSDSLVSTTVGRTEIIDPEQISEMRHEEMLHLWPDLVAENFPPQYIVDPRNKREITKIITTDSDVKKIFQVADFPIGLSFAGDASIQYSTISRGLGANFQAPVETFVTTIVKDVIKSRFSKESYNVHDIGECLSLALSTGFISKKQKGGINFEIIGGGFSSDNVFPLSFKLKLNKWSTGGDRASLLGGSNYWFNRALLYALPIRASSRNWFEDFLKNDLQDCVELSLCSAWWHALTNQYEKEVIERRIIPEVNQMICSNVAILGGILSENPMSYLNQERVSLSDVIGRMWDLRTDNYESKWKDAVSEVISDCRIGDRVCQIWEEAGSQQHDAVSALQDSLESNLINRTYSLEIDYHSDGSRRSYHSRLPENVREVLSEEAYNTLYFLISNYVTNTLLADMFLDSDSDSRNQNFRREYGNDLYAVGQQETIDRIMWGLDLETAGRIGEEVKRFQMHNVKRMGEIVLQKSHNLQRIGPTAFNFYQNENRLGGGSPSADTIGAEGNSDSEQTDLNRFSLAGSSSEIQNSSEEGVGEGKQEFVIPDGASEWKGVISSSENERYRCNVEFNLSAEDSEDNEQGLELTLEGFIDIPESRDILLSGEGRTSNGVYEITRLRFHYPDGEEDLQASLETSEYGIELAISDQELEGASKRTGWKSIVLSPKEYDLELSSEDEQSRDHSLIDPDFILESTSIVYTELQDFEMPYKSSRWNVDYSQMPLSRAVSLAEYLIDSTIKKQIFNSEIPTVGGEILTATISYKDGFNFLE